MYTGVEDLTSANQGRFHSLAASASSKYPAVIIAVLSLFYFHQPRRVLNKSIIYALLILLSSLTLFLNTVVERTTCAFCPFLRYTLPCCSLLPKLEELLQSEVSHVMEPISIVGLVDASVDLALKCASAVKKINDLASKYKSSALALRSIAQNLDTMQFAWDKIGAWTESYTPEENVDDDVRCENGPIP